MSVVAENPATYKSKYSGSFMLLERGSEYQLSFAPDGVTFKELTVYGHIHYPNICSYLVIANLLGGGRGIVRVTEDICEYDGVMFARIRDSLPVVLDRSTEDLGLGVRLTINIKYVASFDDMFYLVVRPSGVRVQSNLRLYRGKLGQMMTELTVKEVVVKRDGGTTFVHTSEGVLYRPSPLLIGLTGSFRNMPYWTDASTGVELPLQAHDTNKYQFANGVLTEVA